MPSESAFSDIREIIALSQEVQTQRLYKKNFDQRLMTALVEERSKLLNGRSETEQREYYSKYVEELIDRIDRANQRIMAEFEEAFIEPQKLEIKEQKIALSKEEASLYMSKHTRKKYLREIGADEKMLKSVLRGERKKREVVVDFTVYSPSWYGKLSNIFFEGMTASLTRNHSKFFDGLYKALRSSDIHIFSRTYVSMMLFTTFISFFISAFVAAFFLVFFKFPIPFIIGGGILAGIIFSSIVLLIFMVYPSTVVSRRERMIKNDLPFVMIHMAAVAGSGAKPISIFKLVAGSGEYKGVESELRKVVNYINLLGYDLSTALRMVASTTPSMRFRDVLNGMISTIESGGSLKSYLNSMAEDTMHTYQEERKKYVQALSTYSDIYTGVLIAAPLLFIVTLAIINLLGGTIGGLSVEAVSMIGTYAAIPFLNIAFIIFLNIMQPEL